MSIQVRDCHQSEPVVRLQADTFCWVEHDSPVQFEWSEDFEEVEFRGDYAYAELLGYGIQIVHLIVKRTGMIGGYKSAKPVRDVQDRELVESILLGTI